MSSLVIHSGRVVTPQSVLDPGYVVVEGSTIAQVGEGSPPPCERAIDAAGLWVLPGFIDIHCHGGGGRSFQEADEEAIRVALAAHLRGGTTGIVPAIAACGREERHACLDALRNGVTSLNFNLRDAEPSVGPGPRLKFKDVTPAVLGAYVEGPYFADKERGAQPLGLIRPPDPEDYRPPLREFGELIRVWALAPELPGALEFIRELREHGVVPALGHSDASEEHVEAAIAAGARLVTHLYCAQSTFHRVGAEKRLGLAEMGLLREELVVEVIADSKHLTPNLLRLVLKSKPPSQVCLITDAMPAAGMPPGEYEFLGERVWVTDEVAYRADRERYAGSVLTMAAAVRNVAAQGADMVAVAEMAALTPARVAGVDRRKGSLEAGKDADVVLMDEGLEVRQVVVRGRTA
ncbi:MAG: N-acetylglucosamine-6-phosphate deacetylase [Armatimonadetes bacterium]|nr:N-acetylglucosamine-6-phosphate deacetylase [Armatimonadota bacterium]